MVGMGSRLKEGTGPRAPRGRHADARRRSYRLQEDPTDVGQAGQPGPARRAQSVVGPAAGDGTPAGDRTTRSEGVQTRAFPKARYKGRQGARATACLRARPTHSLRVMPAS